MSEIVSSAPHVCVHGVSERVSLVGQRTSFVVVRKSDFDVSKIWRGSDFNRYNFTKIKHICFFDVCTATVLTNCVLTVRSYRASCFLTYASLLQSKIQGKRLHFKTQRQRTSQRNTTMCRLLLLFRCETNVRRYILYCCVRLKKCWIFWSSIRIHISYFYLTVMLRINFWGL